MAVKTSTQIREFVAAWMAQLFPTYTVYNSRIRLVESKALPLIVVGVTRGAESEDGEETLTLRIQVTHGAKDADYDDDKGADLTIIDRVEADLYTIRNALNQSTVTIDTEQVTLAKDVGRITGINWDFDANPDGNELAAWVNIDVSISRYMFWSDDMTPDDFETVHIEDEVTTADETVVMEVEL